MKTHPLKRWIAKHGWTAGALARHAEISESGLSLVLRGLRTPKLATAQKLSAATSGDVSWSRIMGFKP